MEPACVVSRQLRQTLLAWLHENKWVIEALVWGMNQPVQLLRTTSLYQSVVPRVSFLIDQAVNSASGLAVLVTSEVLPRLQDASARAICPSLQAGVPLANVWREIWNALGSINESMEFSPMLSSWLFILASMNVTHPSLLRHMSLSRLSRAAGSLLGKLLLPWFLYRYVWIPLNRLIYFVLVDHVGVGESVRSQWLPFLSMAAAILFLLWSLCHTGVWPGLHPAPKRRRHHIHDPVVMENAFQSPYSTRRSEGRKTRSGTIYGKF